ncbi:choice-of-anchor D domain-containing protein [Gelidibacter maritimus]|uniref:Choice-of-anchor D domain-containing protein n=1 Tax=Gelidibacter maritimus TaxID=2761487 RepID=A0A7W2R2T0_9FLAO|nr:choice-of-anchor D domain-containing protein [Gelidibacter maritimus]MBA6152114.1 choice-of-anchor D domain-containing protein [Gelidibacter maritimus]
MIKKYALLLVAFLCIGLSGYGQGSESFTNSNASASYSDGVFLGDNGLTWTYVQSRNEGGFPITGSGLMLRRISDQSRITSSSVPNGIGSFSCRLLKGFTGSGNRQVELFVNGISQGTSITWDNTTVQTFTVNAINITGDVIIEIRNITPYQVVIDDISWTAASTVTVDYCNLQSPQNGNITVGTGFSVYAQVYKAGVTETAGPDSGMNAWIGYNTVNNNPNSPDWTWLPATYSTQTGNNHEYVANIGPTLPSGTYYYASRFQLDGGPYRYGGYSETGGGFWNGTSNQSGELSVDTVDFCNLQFPGIGTINLGEAFDVYGQVYEQGITPGAGQGLGIIAEIGYSLTNSNPNTWTDWIPATYNAACFDCNDGQNDEYSANLGAAITSPGTYYYATRFRLNGGIWLYGGILEDGSAGNFWDGNTYVSGVLNVMAPEIRVEANVHPFLEIVNGDMSPFSLRNTLFAAQYVGASQSKSYRILNLGNLDLSVPSVSIIGANPDDFTITVHPTATIFPGTFSILEIEFSPLAAGVRNAIVSIVNNDSDENPYTFAIRGTGLCITTSHMASPIHGPTGTIVTVTGTNFDGATSASMNGIVMATTLINSTSIEVTIPENAATGHIVVVNSIGCTSSIPFTIIDSQVGGCEGSAALSDLFISEVTDATVGGLSYIEIYNGTGVSVPLGEYSLGIYNNGSSDPTSTIPLQDVALANNSTYVVAIGAAANPTNSNSCPQDGGNGQFAALTSTLISGINKKDNEHDVIRLLKSNGTEVVDEFGVYMDNTWMDATLITGDRGFNFRRLNTALLLPNPIFNLSDWNVIDWVGSGPSSCPTNDYSDIGHFDFSGGASPLVTLQPMAPSSSCVLNATLTVSGVEGVPGGHPLTYQWYYNAPGTANWVEIFATNLDYSGQQSDHLNILSTLDLDGYQYYVQIRENNATCYSASNAVRLKLNQTTWDGFTWNPSIPDQNTTAIINGNYTTSPTSGSFTACNLVVNSGFTLDITEDYYVEVITDVLVKGNSPTNFGDIFVDSNAAFIQRGDDANAGTFTLEIPASARVRKHTAEKQNWYDYTYWSSPVTNETVESVLSMASPSRRFYFEAANYEDTNGDDVDDNGDDWQLATGRMIPGVGYASTSNNSGTFPRIDTTTFNGEFNNGNISVTIHTNTIATDNDWNFIGNPYPSAIDYKLVHSQNSDVISGAAYLWSQASPPLASNPGNQVLNFNRNDYAIITVGSGNIAGGKDEMPSDFIPSGQGFFVIGIHDGGTLTFKNSMRMADATSNSQFFRNAPSDVPNKFWINLTSDNGIFNQILVAYVEGATDGVDGFAYDAERNRSTGLGAIIYTEITDSNKKYAIQGKAVSSLSSDEEVSIGFKTSITQPTLYSLSVAQLQGQFFDDNELFLKDNLLNIHHNLSVSDYHFTSETGEFNDRFVIVFKSQTLSISDYILDTNEVSIIERRNGHVEFSVGQNLNIKSVEIIDVMGRTLNYLKGSKATEIYDLNSLSQAAYIARVKLSNGQIISKRFVLSSGF